MLRPPDFCGPGWLYKKNPLNDFFGDHTSSCTPAMQELCLRSSSDSNFITFTLDLLSFLQNTLGFVIHLHAFSYFPSQNYVWLFFITCVNSPGLHVLLTINYFVYVMINTLLILYQYKICCLLLGSLLYSSKLLKIAICSWTYDGLLITEPPSHCSRDISEEVN